MFGQQILQFSFRRGHVEEVTFVRAELNEFPRKLQHRSLRTPAPEQGVVRRGAVLAVKERHQIHAIEFRIVRLIRERDGCGSHI